MAVKRQTSNVSGAVAMVMVVRVALTTHGWTHNRQLSCWVDVACCPQSVEASRPVRLAITIIKPTHKTHARWDPYALWSASFNRSKRAKHRGPPHRRLEGKGMHENSNDYSM